MSSRRLVLPAALAGLLLALAPGVQAQTLPADLLDALRYRYIGPQGNRISSVAGVAGDPSTYYVGAASGGIWKSDDAGISWRPLFDDQEVEAIGALAVAPSDPQVVWAGTGEPHLRSNVSVGDGVYRSTDGGAHWTHMGLPATGRISRIVIHPSNPDVVYVAALGHAHAPQRERGIYRTRDGGRTWEQVLFVDENTGASSLMMDPNNPRILFAGMWTVEMHHWGRESGGPGSGVYASRDGGDSWTKLTGHGLPQPPIGKVDVCMTPADSRVVYAMIETGDGVPLHGQPTDTGELWRSTDGGATWELRNNSRDLGGRTAYYNQCRVGPDDADEVYFLAAAYSRTLDGGTTYRVEQGPRRPGGDHHDMWIDPLDADRQIVVHDQGLSISTNRGETWHRVQLPIGQMYHVTVDNAVPYHVMGNRQDGPSARGPSNTRYGGTRGAIPRGDWRSVGGGESGFATPDPTDPDIVWSSASGSGARGGIVVRWDARTGQFRNVEVWPESTGGVPAREVKYRFQWTFPLLVSPHDHNTLYVTSQVVHRTTNGGQSWDVISPDLTTNDTTKMGISGGLTPDNIGVEYCCVIYAFDESPAEQGVFYAGSNDGKVHVSRDDGAHWTDVTANFPEWPANGVVRGIDASKWDAGKAYLVVEAHLEGDFEPYAYKTTDYGAHWTKITAGLPDHILSFTRDIEEDPVRPGLLYLGTENHVYVSFDDGANWQALVNNLPPAPMYGLVVQEHFNDLAIATYGRGFWILDDVTPLQQLTAEVRTSTAHLFEPRAAYRFQQVTDPFEAPNDWTNGDNPPYGAALNYWLGAEAAGQDASVSISDASGTVVRTLRGTSEAGLNRVWWDLEGENSSAIVMRTTPMYADWRDLGPERTRTISNGMSVLEPPGTYTVTLEVGGRSYTRSLEVRKDPTSEGTVADIRAQTDLLESIRGEHDRAAKAVNGIEWVRRQLQDLVAVLSDQGDAGDLVQAAHDLESRFIAVEEELTQLRTTGTGQDGVRYPSKVVEKLSHLAGGVGTADFRPTDQQGEVNAVLLQMLEHAEQGLSALLQSDLAQFNRTLRDRGLNPLISDGA
jgi:photosystem II stability/assembly factor-like uncharacterized protein